MKNPQLESNYPISNLTVAELEALITKIVQTVMREENSTKKVSKEIVGSLLIPNNLDNAQTPRISGLWRGQVQISDDFDILPESISAAFTDAME